MAHSTIRDAPINLRALPIQRSLIDKAAAVLGKSRSDFMLEVVCREAENVLMNQQFFHLDAAEFEAFEKALGAPVEDNPTLQKLMKTKAPWEA